MSDTEPDPAEAGRELLRLIDDLRPVLHYGVPVSDQQWREDKAKRLAELRGEIAAPAEEASSSEPDR